MNFGVVALVSPFYITYIPRSWPACAVACDALYLGIAVSGMDPVIFLNHWSR